MSRLRAIASRFCGLFGRQRLDRELDEELRFHLEMQIEDNLAAGMDPAEARREAMRSFGGVEQVKEQYRERRAFAAIETTALDLRYALRTLSKSPGYTISAGIVLALAIGANTAMFTALNAVLFRPLPFRSPEQLAMLWTEVPSQNLREGRSSNRSAEQWRNQSRSFAAIEIFDPASVTLTGAGHAERISAVRISAGLFPLLGIEPLRGRLFSAGEAKQLRRLCLIGERFWRSRFGGSESAIGASLELDGATFQIVGILPANFEFPEPDADVWQPDTISPGGAWFVVGRLRPDITIEQAQQEMSALGQRLDEQAPPSERGRGVSVVPLTLHLTGPKARLALWTLAGAVFCVLLIAATNVASLSLARNSTRERELAIRAALGASRARIVRQLLVESLTLAAASGLAGLLLAVAGMRFIAAWAPAELPRLNDLALDWRALGCAATLCLLAGVLVGIAPAVTLTRKDGAPRGRGVAGRVATRRLRRALVVAQFALAIVLLAGAGLLLRSLQSVRNVELGFRPARVLAIQLSTTSLPAAQRAAFYSRVLEEVESLPGVESVGVIENFFISSGAEQTIATEGGSQRLRYRSDEASPAFFRTVGTPMLRGRFFSAADRPGALRVAIVNDTLARLLWPGLDPLGRRFRPSADADGPWLTVVGVAGDMRRQGLENQPLPQMFVPISQSAPRLATLLARATTGDALRISPAVQAAVRRIEKHAPVYGAATLESRLGGFLAQRRFQTSLLTAFSFLSLLIAATGIYGLIQYSVQSRTQEIGIRFALGARAGEIFREVIGEGLRLGLTGLAIGLAGAFWLGRVGSSLLFGVTGSDPVTFAATSLLLMAVASAACYFPARRAMKVDPIVALRQD